MLATEVSQHEMSSVWSRSGSCKALDCNLSKSNVFENLNCLELPVILEVLKVILFLNELFWQLNCRKNTDKIVQSEDTFVFISAIEQGVGWGGI